MRLFGAVQGLSFGPVSPPEDFGELARGVGAGLVRAELAWAEVEPVPGSYDWAEVDRLLTGVAGWGRLWLSVRCRSPWGTRTGSGGASSPPLDEAAFRRFVTELCRHCGDSVRYWQCESEPAAGDNWAGTPGEYARLATSFAGAVRAVAEAPVLVLGGLSGDAPEQASRDFFRVVVPGAAGDFDLLDLHVDGGRGRLHAQFERAREVLGDDDRLVVGEQRVPGPGELVTASVLALANGASAVCYRVEDRLAELSPTLRMLCRWLAGSTGARRIDVSGRPEVYAVEVGFDDPGRSVQVFWREDDAADAEADLREALEWHWVHSSLHVAAADAEPLPMPAWASGRLALPLSGSPVLVSTEPLDPDGRSG